LTVSWQFGGLRASKEKESRFSDDRMTNRQEREESKMINIKFLK